MINKEDIAVGNRLTCSVLSFDNLLITKVDNDGIHIEGREYPLGLDPVLECTFCIISHIPVKSRFQLIEDQHINSNLESSMTKTQAQEEIASIVSEDTGDLNNFGHEISNLKDQLFQKVKHKAQQEQAKKDMASSYREVIGTLKEEIEELVVKITSLQDQQKINKLIK
jgi:hypothetical protein